MYPPSGTWILESDNAAQMARVFVEAEAMLASHPHQGLSCVNSGDLDAAEYWYNEAADAALAALSVPTVFWDQAVAKRIKKMRDSRDRETWTVGFGLGDTESALRNIYLDAAMSHVNLVLDASDRFPSDAGVSDRVSRHFRDTLDDAVDGSSANEFDFIFRIRRLRSEVEQPKPGMTFKDARRIAFASGVPLIPFLTANQIGTKRISRERWKGLQRDALKSVTRRMTNLAHRCDWQALLSELGSPGSGEGNSVAGSSRQPSAPDWYPDPSGRHQFRYFDGLKWTENVANDGIISSDELHG